MRRRLAALAMALVAGGCFSSSVVDSMTDPIPEGANRVRLHSTLRPAEFFRQIQQGLISQGYRLATIQESACYLTTDSKNVGERTGVRMAITVAETKEGSHATISGEWIPIVAIASTVTGEAKWISKFNRFNEQHAFAAMVVALKKIPHERVEYLTE